MLPTGSEIGIEENAHPLQKFALKQRRLVALYDCSVNTARYRMYNAADSRQSRTAETLGFNVLDNQVPITELPNTLSIDIDIASPECIATTLHACDKEIFEGWGTSSGLQDTVIIDKLYKVAMLISNVVQNPSAGCVVISGCGTSGRLAYLTSRRFNKYLRSQGQEECFNYIISGDNDALYSSVELAEDDPSEGAKRLREVVEGKTRVVYIGVTCGLSAPFVAGQLEMCLSDLETFTPVLLGFNPAHQARKTQMKNLNKTFHQVVKNMMMSEQEEKAFILNPIIGPEPVAGSSRMKSGTTTKIVLDILALLGTASFHSALCLSAPRLVEMYKDVCDTVYGQAKSLGSLAYMAKQSLRNNGHLYYLGCDALGLIGIVDASECRPTFGASFHDIRGFVSGGIDDLDSRPISSTLSTEDFDSEILPNLDACDTVIIFGADMLQRVNSRLFSFPCKRAFVNFITDEESSSALRDEVTSSKLDLTITVDICFALNFLGWPQGPQETFNRQKDGGPAVGLPTSPEAWSGTSGKMLLMQLAREAAMKWTVNCTSTSAYIQLGKVYRNLMVDVRVSNAKLFYRACGIVKDICNIGEAESCTLLLKSIYDEDNLSKVQTSGDVVNHILAASEMDKVVPIAILMGLRSCSVQQARSLLDTQPNLSRLLKDFQ
ncbi:hypothetical protein RRG08_003273 [Elysia crispata]|uniref:Glucokinase regulatory protein n=1 Tax=Elysia crispata TaxID=231223 RepID=A0AAE0YLW3_9GAST|nr:hypothetical protein RRG08_003273 [Elysia crispata]